MSKSKIDGISIQIPKSKVNEGNLRAIISGKQELIKKALGVTALEFSLQGNNKYDFPWFKASAQPDEIKAYMQGLYAVRL